MQNGYQLYKKILYFIIFGSLKKGQSVILHRIQIFGSFLARFDEMQNINF